MSKDLIGIFKPEAKTVKQIFTNSDSYYQIPDYQRPYRWDDEQIEQLWDDIFSAVESKNESYFLGPMILIGSKDNEYFEVVDGQQRLTTLMILFCVLRDFYLKDNKEIKSAIKSLETDQYRLRLKSQPYYQNQFEQEILNGIAFPDKELSKREREKNKYINTALIFQKKLGEIKNLELSKLVNYLLNKVVMISIICSNRDFAINLFQVINTRGLDLEPADLIKSHLLEKCKNKEDQFIATWDEIVTSADQIEESLTDLFTYYEYYLLAQNPEKSLYEELSNKFKNKDPNKIIYEFKKFVEAFVNIYQMDSKLSYSFWYLPNQVFWKAILTTAKYEGFDDFNGLCKELRKMYYSYWVAGYTTSKIKQLSFNLINWIKNKKKLNDIKNMISQTMKDHKVSVKIEESLRDDAYGEKWLRPILALIEYEQTDDSKRGFIELNNKLHVDHILPEKWNHQKSEWNKYWNEEQASNCLNKIGNLTLLSGKKNIAQRNDPPRKKAEMYKKGHGGKTAFEISKNIIKDLEKGKWTEDKVKYRQKWMTKQIKKILV